MNLVMFPPQIGASFLRWDAYEEEEKRKREEKKEKKREKKREKKKH